MAQRTQIRLGSAASQSCIVLIRQLHLPHKLQKATRSKSEIKKNNGPSTEPCGPLLITEREFVSFL